MFDSVIEYLKGRNDDNADDNAEDNAKHHVDSAGRLAGGLRVRSGEDV